MISTIRTIKGPSLSEKNIHAMGRSLDVSRLDRVEKSLLTPPEGKIPQPFRLSRRHWRNPHLSQEILR